MTQRSLERISLPDGREVSLTVTAPESAVRGGIIVVPDAPDVTDAVWRLATGLAGEGWLAVVPQRGHREGAEGFVHAGTDAALSWLAQREVATDRIGVMGVGFGGAVALIVATQRDLGAAVTLDGIGIVAPVVETLPALVDVAPHLRCPWLGIYGRDGEVPDEQVHKLRDAAHSARVATDLVRCSFDTDQPVAPEAWTRTLNWFDSHLR